MKRTIALLSFGVVLAIGVFAPSAFAAKAIACRHCCQDKCGQSCCQDGCTDNCCQGGK